MGHHAPAAPAIVVAVLDTGMRFDHPDLAGRQRAARLRHDQRRRPGTFTSANDGDGRDADASDPGDFVRRRRRQAAAARLRRRRNSSWHGTQTARPDRRGDRTTASASPASAGNVRVLPVRVLGKCGGFDSDIVAGMLLGGRASTCPACPTTPNPARVINMSLGGAGACSAGLHRRDRRRSTPPARVVVASAGNSAGHAVGTPGQLPGRDRASPALRHVGTKVGFSDLGPADHDQRAGRQLRQHARRHAVPVPDRDDDATRARRRRSPAPPARSTPTLRRVARHQLLGAARRRHRRADALGAAVADAGAGQGEAAVERARRFRRADRRTRPARHCQQCVAPTRRSTSCECVLHDRDLRRRHARRARARCSPPPACRRASR